MLKAHLCLIKMKTNYNYKRCPSSPRLMGMKYQNLNYKTTNWLKNLAKYKNQNKMTKIKEMKLICIQKQKILIVKDKNQ